MKKPRHGFTQQKRLAIFLRDGFRCVYCDSNLRHGPAAQITIDHVIPRFDGGGDHASNVITACLSCNQRRGHMALDDFANRDTRLRIQRQLNRPLNMKQARIWIQKGTKFP